MSAVIRCDECKGEMFLHWSNPCSLCAANLCQHCYDLEHNCPGRDKLRDLAERS